MHVPLVGLNHRKLAALRSPQASRSWRGRSVHPPLLSRRPTHLVSSACRPPAACAMPEHLHSATPREAPKFPVINAEPTAGAVIANFALYDYGRMLFVTTLGAAWGFAGGASCFRATRADAAPGAPAASRASATRRVRVRRRDGLGQSEVPLTLPTPALRFCAAQVHHSGDTASGSWRAWG